MSKIEIKDLYLIFGNEKQKALKMLKKDKSKEEILKDTGCTVGVKDANLSINEGEFFVIMGLSGSGKSTLLRCINRLIRPTTGQVLVNGVDISKISEKELLQVRRKELAMVFQNFGLLPHRSVLSNIAFGLELQGVKKEEREKKAMESMKLVGLKGYENQMVGELSGGMQQRVGLARALANNPEVLLMDEAFSALDPLIRVQMQDELLALQSKMKKTIVFITHDLSEAIKLGDRIAIMKDGEVVQVGTSEEILTEPANDYVARFVENVDRSKIITASSLMIDKPLVARLKKEGPEVLIRKMRAKNITVLPVIDADDKLVGEVRLNDLLKLRSRQEKSIETVVRTEVHSVLEDTVLEDILPLMTKSNSPVWVIDETREFLGTIPLSSLIIEVTGKDLTDVVSLIKTAKGDTVHLTIAREGEKDYLEFDVERSDVAVPTVAYKMLDDEIGYIAVSEFDKVTAEQFKNALAKLEEQGMEKLIIDLRNNLGGVLDTCCEMLKQMLPKGLIVYTEDKYGQRTEYTCDGNNEFKKPLAVLVNGYSVSAAEIFSGAIKDYGIGTLVGTKTYGKGIVQRIVGMEDGTAVKLTVSKYFTPNGTDIHKKGIEPDVTVELDESLKNKVTVTEEEDNQLQKAISILQEEKNDAE